MAHDIQRRGRRQRVGTQFCVKEPAGQVTNCPWKFWSAGEPDLGLPGLVRGQLRSLISWDDCAPVQWWRGWKTKTGRRAAAKGAKLGRYVATEIEKLTHIRIWIWITTSKNTLEFSWKKTLQNTLQILHIWVWFAWKSLTSHLSLGSGFQGRVGQDLGGRGLICCIWLYSSPAIFLITLVAYKANMNTNYLPIPWKVCFCDLQFKHLARWHLDPVSSTKKWIRWQLKSYVPIKYLLEEYFINGWCTFHSQLPIPT